VGQGQNQRRGPAGRESRPDQEGARQESAGEKKLPPTESSNTWEKSNGPDEFSGPFFFPFSALVLSGGLDVRSTHMSQAWIYMGMVWRAPTGCGADSKSGAPLMSIVEFIAIYLRLSVFR